MVSPRGEAKASLLQFPSAPGKLNDFDPLPIPACSVRPINGLHEPACQSLPGVFPGGDPQPTDRRYSELPFPLQVLCTGIITRVERLKFAIRASQIETFTDLNLRRKALFFR
jgi:hypothetical protein